MRVSVSVGLLLGEVDSDPGRVLLLDLGPAGQASQPSRDLLNLGLYLVVQLPGDAVGGLKQFQILFHEI